MRKRDLETIRKESIKNLTKKVDELRIEAETKQVEFYAGKSTDPKGVSKIKRDISQILTIISEKQKEAKIKKNK